MGQLIATIELTNLATIGKREKPIVVEALIDTGATALCITEKQALLLGRDINEAEQRLVVLANDSEEWAAYLPMIELNYGGLTLVVNAYVLPGLSQALLGAVPLEELNLVLDLAKQSLTPRWATIRFTQPKMRLVVSKP